MDDLMEAKEQRLNAFVFDYSSKSGLLVRTLVRNAGRHKRS